MKKITMVALVLTTACIGVRRVILMDRSAYPVPPREVTIFLPDEDIPGDCARVALLNAAGDHRHADFGDLVKRLREKAGELGANAIDIQFMSQEGTWGRHDPNGNNSEDARVRWAWVRRDARAFALYCPGGTSKRR